MSEWSPFSYVVTNLARFVRPNEITFSGVNSTPPGFFRLMVSCCNENTWSGSTEIPSCLGT